MAAATATMSTPADETPAEDSAMGESETLYTELISFLSSPRADLRKAAAEATLAALTSDNNTDAASRLTSLDAMLPLCRIASVASSEVGSNEALAALSILSSHDLVGNQCVIDFIESAKGVGRMLEIALSSPPTPPSTAASIAALGEDGDAGSEKLAADWNEWRKRVNYACALLANATRTEKGAVEFIGLSFPEEAVPSSMTKARKGEEKESAGDDGEGGGRLFGMRDAKPTAALLLSRFLNPAFIDTLSPAYTSALEAWDDAAKKQALVGAAAAASKEEDYDPDLDLDDEQLEQDRLMGMLTHERPSNDSTEPQKVEPTLHENEYYDPYQHVAAVIMNITQLDAGREFLMKIIYSNPSKSKSTTAGLATTQEDAKKNKDAIATSHLQSLLPQLTSPNLSRRQGIAGTLKNSCFAQDSIWWLMNVVHFDKSLLMTLAGPEDLDIDEKVGLDPDYWLLGPAKVREPNALVRLYCAEAILLLLASGRRARETLRERRTYVIVKLADMVEENEQVSERLLECIQYLRRDEDGTEEGSSDARAYEKYAKGMLAMDDVKNTGLKALPMSTTVKDDVGADDYDEID